MKYLSVCSGIEAASVAWRPLGWKAAAVAEIEPFPRAVLAHRWPEVPNLGDVTKFQTWPDYAIKLLVGGTPCQSFSVAGLRQGLRDPRGNLMLTFGAIAARTRPRWLVWENVPGVLSSNGGRDFGSFLGLLGELGYGFAYRILDAQHFGLAQRRKRVFVVGCLGDWRRAAAVLFERASLRWDSPPRRETGKDLAPTISARTKGGGGLGTDFDCDGGLISAPIAFAGMAQAGGGWAPPSCPTSEDLALPLDATRAQSIAFDTTQITSRENRCNPQPGDACHPLTGQGHAPAIAFRGSGQDGFTPSEISPPLCNTDGGGTVPTIAFPGRLSGTQCASSEDVSPSIGAANPMAVAFQTRIARNGRGQLSEVVPALNGSDAGATSDMRPCIATAAAARRLTPRECERLQGFPDDYTLIPFRGKTAADGPRYKALGNSMAVPVMAWIGRRIAMVDSL